MESSLINSNIYINLGKNLVKNKWKNIKICTTFSDMQKKGVTIKVFNSNSLNFIKEIKKTNEIVCCNLANQIGVACLPCEMAHKDDVNGIITKQNLNRNQKIISAAGILYGTTNSYSNFKKSLEMLQKSYKFKLDKDEILFHIYKIAVFDLLTFQTDRHKYNVPFIVEKENDGKSLMPYPIYDNEFSFGLRFLYKKLVNKQGNKNFDETEFLKQYCHDAMCITFSKKHSYNYEDLVDELIVLSKSNPLYKTFLLNAINSINIDKCLNDIKKKGVILTKEQEDIYSNCINLSKKIFVKELLKHKILTKKQKTALNAEQNLNL